MASRSLILSFLSIVLLGSQAFSQAQQERVFTLQEAIDYALVNSFGVKNIGLNLDAASENLTASKGAFKTNANVFLQTPNIAKTFSPEDNPTGLRVYNTREFTRFLGEININQPLPTNGLFTLRTSLFQDQNAFISSDDFRNERKEFFTSFSLRFNQPIFAVNTLKLGLEEANLEYENSTLQLRRTELDVIFNVTQVFYSLYRATRTLEIARDELQQQQQAYELASKKYEAGLIPEVEALQTEVDLAQSRNRVFTAETALRRQQDLFKQTIGMALQQPVTVVADLDFTPIAIDVDRAVAFALQNRTEVREAEIDKRLREISIRRTQGRSQFRADVSAFYDLSGVSDPTLPIGTNTFDLLESSWNDLRDRPRNRGVTLNFSMPLWDSGVNRAEVAAARARLQQSELALANERVTVEREVKDVVSRVLEAQNRLDVLARSQQVAERSYEISLARFDNGDIAAQQLALDRDRLTQARSTYLDAYIDYQTALADLKRKTLYDFERNRSLIDENR